MKEIKDLRESFGAKKLDISTLPSLSVFVGCAAHVETSAEYGGKDTGLLARYLCVYSGGENNVIRFAVSGTFSAEPICNGFLGSQKKKII